MEIDLWTAHLALHEHLVLQSTMLTGTLGVTEHNAIPVRLDLASVAPASHV